MEPSPYTPPHSRAFQRHQEHDLKHPGSVDLITTKQKKTNKLPSFIDRFTLPTHIICTFVSWLFCFVCWNWVACKIYLTQVGAVVFTRIFTLGKGYVAHLLNLERSIYPSRRTELCCVVRWEWVKFMFLGGRGDYDPWTVGTIVCCGDTQLATNLKCVLFWLQVSTPIRFKDQAIVLII